MNAQKQIQRFDAAVLMALPEVDEELRQWWIENPSELQAHLVDLAKKPCPKLEIWKTIKLGIGIKDADGFRKTLEEAGMKIGDWANNILGQPAFTVAQTETEVDLVRLTVAEFGFRNGARRDKIYERALEVGLQLCPAEVGPQLRLQYTDQPNNEWLLIGMEPIRYSDGSLRVFRVERYGSGLWLYGDDGNPDDVWGPGNRWVFVRPRK